MSDTSSSAALRVCVLALVGVLACTTERDIDVKPFRIAATIDGAPLPAGISEFIGDVTLRDATRILATNLEGQVLELSFDAQAAAGVEFPAELVGRVIGLVIQVDDGHFGPDGAELRVPAFRLLVEAGGFFEYRMLMGEGTYETGNGLPSPPLIIFPTQPGEFPGLTVIPDHLYFEPAECGLLYYDRLRVHVGERRDLPFDEEERVPFGEPAVHWTVRHVLSWHRSKACPGETRTWTQLAMWRS